MKIVQLVILSIVIASCNNSLKKNLGLVRETPDEFKVVSQPDLTMPPDFDLVPPQFPIESYQFNAKVDHNNLTTSNFTESENEFLGKIGIAFKDSSIRKQINLEQKHFDYTTDHSVKKRLNSIIHPDEDKTKIIDPVLENKRLQNNIRENKPITNGEVESIKKQKSVLDKILGH